MQQVSVNEAKYNFSVHFYEFCILKAQGTQCSIEDCETCVTNQPENQTKNCSIRFWFLLRPYGASLTGAPTAMREFPFSTPRGGDNHETFEQGENGFLGLSNPYTFTNSTNEWTVS